MTGFDHFRKSSGCASQGSFNRSMNNWGWLSERSVSCGTAPAAKAEVEAGFQDALGFVDPEEEGCITDEGKVATA